MNSGLLILYATGVVSFVRRCGLYVSLMSLTALIALSFIAKNASSCKSTEIWHKAEVYFCPLLHSTLISC